jgi:hypothetical protein
LVVGRYVGDLERGLFHGYGEYTCRSGDVFKGHFFEGKKHGAGKMFYRDGATFEGHWTRDARRAGEGLMKLSDGDAYSGRFNAKGLYHGLGRLERGESGDVFEGNFKEGRKEGEGRMVRTRESLCLEEEDDTIRLLSCLHDTTFCESSRINKPITSARRPPPPAAC